MKATQTLHDLGQSLWLDNITRNLLRTGALRRYIDELSITGLTSNPTIVDHAIKNGKDYDDAIKSKLAEGRSGEKLFFELALEDLTQAADLFRSVYDRTCGIDGWVSLEVSPLLAHDTKSTSRGQGPARPGPTSQSLDQDSWHQGRFTCDRRGDLRRHTSQRHPVVLRRPVSGGCQCIHARHRTAHRCGIKARCWLGGIDLH